MLVDDDGNPLDLAALLGEPPVSFRRALTITHAGFQCIVRGGPLGVLIETTVTVDGDAVRIDRRVAGLRSGSTTLPAAHLQGARSNDTTIVVYASDRDDFGIDAAGHRRSVREWLASLLSQVGVDARRRRQVGESEGFTDVQSLVGKVEGS